MISRVPWMIFPSALFSSISQWPAMFDSHFPSIFSHSIPTERWIHSPLSPLPIPNEDFLKWGNRYPQIIRFNGIFHFKLTIFGYQHLWTPPYPYPTAIKKSSVSFEFLLRPDATSRSHRGFKGLIHSKPQRPGFE